jgi:hypothetical protein
MSRIILQVLLVCLSLAAIALTSQARAEICGHGVLGHMDQAQLRIQRNAVFARHGRAFKSADLQAHFSSQPWYRVDPSYTDARLTSTDRACIDRVKRWESAHRIIRLTEDLSGAEAKNRVAILDGRPAGEDTCSDAAACELIVVIDHHWRAIPAEWQRDADSGQVEVEVIDIRHGDNRRELRISQRAGWYEDPPIQNQLFRLTSTLETVELSGSGYGTGALQVSGDNLVKMKDSDCTGDQTRELEYWYRMGDSFLEKDQTLVLNSSRGCAACPHLEQRLDGEWVARGEVLRFMNSADEADWENTQLFHSGGDLVLRLSERKHEITHLDAVELSTSQGRILPRSCTTDVNAWCEEDGRHHLMVQGDELELHFALPHSSLGRVQLRVSGFYVPLESGEEHTQ